MARRFCTSCSNAFFFFSAATAVDGDQREWSVFINKNGTNISKGYLAAAVHEHDSTCITTLVILNINVEIQIITLGGEVGDSDNVTVFDATNLSIIKF